MSTNRVAAFSDGVIAIIITIMVLELKVPHEASLAALLEITPIFLSYLLSFVVVAIMWVNHHHILHTAKRADAHLLWANNILLFWMSLISFATAYMGENHNSPTAVALYGGVLALTGMAFTWLRYVINRQHGSLSDYNKQQIGKSIFSTLLYGSSVPLAYASVYISLIIFLLIPVLYFLPERKLAEAEVDVA